MIAFIEGKLIECQLNLAIIQVGGIGYEAHIPLTTSEKLPTLGSEVKLFTHASYREDSQTLYGFIDRESRDFFKMIVDKVSGIGPKIALNLLGSLSLPILKTSIASGDVGMLSKAQGLGKKLPDMELEEQIQLLLENGNLVKRPFVLTSDSGIVGFKEDAWKELFKI